MTFEDCDVFARRRRVPQPNAAIPLGEHAPTVNGEDAPIDVTLVAAEDG